MWINFLGLAVGLLLLELLYFMIAGKLNIVDKPNTRSSHRHVTIRGGGIIFPIAGLIFLPLATFEGVLFCASLLLITCLSFTDDVRDVDSRIRLIIQSIAVTGLLYPFIGTVDWIWLPISFVLVTGIINAYNFMDGINGITVLYSAVTIGSLFWVSEHIFFLQPAIFFLAVLAALSVFSFFNLRKRAKCFAGDVGSVSMAFIICFLLINLSVKTGSFIWILLLGIYGIDTVFTIVCRLARKEPIFKAHRSHFYQFLVNEQGINPLIVASIYALAQLILNVAVIFAYRADMPLVAVASLFVFLLIYTIFRLRFEGRYRLFTAY